MGDHLLVGTLIALGALNDPIQYQHLPIRGRLEDHDILHMYVEGDFYSTYVIISKYWHTYLAWVNGIKVTWKSDFSWRRMFSTCSENFCPVPTNPWNKAKTTVQTRLINHFMTEEEHIISRWECEEAWYVLTWPHRLRLLKPSIFYQHVIRNLGVVSHADSRTLAPANKVGMRDVGLCGKFMFCSLLIVSYEIGSLIRVQRQ